MRSAALACLALLVTAAPAGAFGELPFASVPAASCVRATGVPGGVAQVGALGRRGTTVDLLRVSAAGTTVSDRVRPGLLAECPAVAEADGAAVLAGPVFRLGTDDVELRAAVRDPGASHPASVRLSSAHPLYLSHSAAVSASGAAAVVATQTRGASRERVVAYRRAPGGSFGQAEPLTAWSAHDGTGTARTAVAIGADGAVTAAWTRAAGRSKVVVETATAAPGGAFGRPQPLGRPGSLASAPALAVADDGRALLAASDDDGTEVYERAPGAQAFAVAAHLPWSPTDSPPAVALRRGGGAAVAWSHGYGGGLSAVTRPGPGPFGEPRELASGRERGFGVGEAVLVATARRGPFAPYDSRGGEPRIALGEDGAAALSWIRAGAVGRVWAAAGTLVQGFAPARPLGGDVRAAVATAPLRLADGTRAIAWTDGRSFRRAARRHLSVEGVAGADPAPPRVRLTVPRGQRLFGDEPLRAWVRCSAACDVRVVARRGRREVATAGGAIGRAGRTLVRVRRGLGGVQNPWKGGRVRVVARASAPGGTRAARAAVTARVLRRPVPPFAAPTAVAARREGRRIVVTWRTGVAARRVSYYVAGYAARGRPPREDALRMVRGRGRRTFRVVLTPRRPVRLVEVVGASRDADRERRVTVRVQSP